jgi:hypothetical protein
LAARNFLLRAAVRQRWTFRIWIQMHQPSLNDAAHIPPAVESIGPRNAPFSQRILDSEGDFSRARCHTRGGPCPLCDRSIESPDLTEEYQWHASSSSVPA